SPAVDKAPGGREVRPVSIAQRRGGDFDDGFSDPFGPGPDAGAVLHGDGAGLRVAGVAALGASLGAGVAPDQVRIAAEGDEAPDGAGGGDLRGERVAEIGEQDREGG